MATLDSSQSEFTVSDYLCSAPAPTALETIPDMDLRKLSAIIDNHSQSAPSSRGSWPGKIDSKCQMLDASQFVRPSHEYASNRPSLSSTGQSLNPSVSSPLSQTSRPRPSTESHLSRPGLDAALPRTGSVEDTSSSFELPLRNLLVARSARGTRVSSPATPITATHQLLEGFEDIYYQPADSDSAVLAPLEARESEDTTSSTFQLSMEQVGAIGLTR
ncbi:hypothetical protein HDU91_004249 [Kappamyces sp. JEL0680]|nr:hypothetical protein HDU91_004249 [Kappamyces sp. JEL0680]